MKYALVLAVLVGCGGGKGNGIFCLCDSPPDPDDGREDFCNPISQTGCNANEKCAWFQDQEVPTKVGHIGCALLDGTEAPIGAACTFPPPGPAAFDNCEKGGVCVDGECETICDPNMVGAASGCDTVHNCIRHSDIFEVGGFFVAGACDAACDPLTQAELPGAGELAACGSSDPSTPTLGCYTFDFERFVCLAADADVLDRTDRQPAKLGASGNALVAGCAPGFVPFFFEMTGSVIVTCAGLCAPLEIDNTQPQNATGDPTAIAKLPREPAPAAGNGICTPGKKGSEAKQDCVFLWSFLADGSGFPGPSPFNETLGVCFGYTHFQFDSNNDGVPDTTFPGCENLPPRSAATPGSHDDAADFGCQTIAHSPGGVPMLRAFRLAMP